MVLKASGNWLDDNICVPQKFVYLHKIDSELLSFLILLAGIFVMVMEPYCLVITPGLFMFPFNAF